ncbi:MAG: hypothetical protein QNK37_03560 [Acidobacteriota bacterium]|nr:hypothetical protein [Acidobacteriota bacterium]
MEIRNHIPKLDIQLVADNNMTCIRDLEGYRRGRARRHSRGRASTPDLVVVAMRSAVRAREALDALEIEPGATPIVTVVGDDPAWDEIGGTVHIHRDDDLLTAINQVVIGKSLLN